MTKKFKTPIEMCLVRIPRKPIYLKISSKDWKIMSNEFKQVIEELDKSIFVVLSEMWSEELQKYPEKAKLFDE